MVYSGSACFQELFDCHEAGFVGVYDAFSEAVVAGFDYEFDVSGFILDGQRDDRGQ